LVLRLDDRAAGQLRALPPEGQTQVMATDVSASRNVSAVVSSLCQKVGGGGSGSGCGGGGVASFAGVQAAQAANQAAALQALAAAQAQALANARIHAMLPPTRSPHAAPPSSQPPASHASSPGVEAYIAQYNLDERAAVGLRSLPEASQLEVMGTDISAARNVNAVVSTLVRDAARSLPTASVLAGVKRPRE